MGNVMGNILGNALGNILGNALGNILGNVLVRANDSHCTASFFFSTTGSYSRAR
jgi:outer membrane lipoprotein SlyB